MAVDDASRPLANYPLSVFFSIPELSFLSPNVEILESYTKKVDVMVSKMKDMVVDTSSAPVDKVKLIDLLCHLGVSYHFESEIDNQLNAIFTSNSLDYKEYDLSTVAILFRVLRQHGYKVSCDVFDKFKSSDGEFKKFMESDVKGLLSLYEAAHLYMHGEDMLDEAMTYTRKHLKSLQSECDPRLDAQITYSLKQSYQRGIPIIEVRRFICLYEEDEFCDKTLLSFAKINFNRLQLLYQQELNELLSWRSQLSVEKHFFYARDRLVETYMWSLGTYFEPKYRRARIFWTKYGQILTFTDDTYDAFGTPDELRLLTKAIQRWDIEALETVPENMKFLYRNFLDLYNEMENTFKKEGESEYMTYLKDAVIQGIETYQIEVEWLNKGYEPTFEEYLENALISSLYHVIQVISLLGMVGETVGFKEFVWLKDIPKIDRASCTISRIKDDLVAKEHELMEGRHISNSLGFYMKQYGVCEEDARKELLRKVDDAWKDINEEFVKPTSVSTEVLTRILNLSRVIDAWYKDKDTYTYSMALKDDIKSVLVDAIQIE